MADKKYNWVALIILGIFLLFGVIAPNTDAFASVSDFTRQRQLPDLATTHIDVSRTLSGSLYLDTILVTVENKGGSTARDFVIELRDTSYAEVIATFEVESLAVKELHNFEAYYQNAPDQYTLQIFVDKYNTVEELDEGNNAPIRIVP